jgi:hypothetical protein
MVQALRENEEAGLDDAQIFAGFLTALDDEVTR